MGAGSASAFGCQFFTPQFTNLRGNCISIAVWHKLYSSAARKGFPEKAQKDLLQAATLAAVLVEQDDAVLADALSDAPAAMVAVARTRLPALRKTLASHPQTLAQFETALQTQAAAPIDRAPRPCP